MKKLLLPLLALTLMAGSYAGALVKAPDFEKASAKVKEEGYVIFAYADGWDRYSEKMCKALLKAKSVNSALGSAVVMEVGVPQNPSEARLEAQKKQLGKLALPKPSGMVSYPAVVFYDSNGRYYSIICGKEMVFPEPADLAKSIKARLTGLEKQQELLKKAESAAGVEKARLLGQAASIPNIERPDKVVDQIKKADPQDQSGYVRSLSLNPWAFVEGLVKKSTPEEALAKLEEMLKDSAYTADQKQFFYAAMIGFHRRSKSAADKAKIPALAEKMRELNPESDLGRAAARVAADWSK